MKKDSQDRIVYLHTTHTIIDYVNNLSKKYFPNLTTVHLLDENILADIKLGNLDDAKDKLQNLIKGSQISGCKKIMITCSSTGELLDSLNIEDKKQIVRIETPAIDVIKRKYKNTGVIFTNPPVWPQIQRIIKERNADLSKFSPCYVEHAFDALLNGDIDRHDGLIKSYIENNSHNYDSLFLAQVSLCSAYSRLGIIGVDTPLVLMAELGIISLLN